MRAEKSTLTIDVKVNGLNEIVELRKELESLRKLGVKKKTINLIIEQILDFKRAKE